MSSNRFITTNCYPTQVNPTWRWENLIDDHSHSGNGGEKGGTDGPLGRAAQNTPILPNTTRTTAVGHRFRREHGVLRDFLVSVLSVLNQMQSRGTIALSEGGRDSAALKQSARTRCLQ